MNAVLQAWWQARNDAERRALTLGGLLLAVLLIAGGGVLPLLEQHHALAARLPGLRASTAALEAQAQEAIALRAHAGNAPVAVPVPGGQAGVAGLRASLEAAGLRGEDDTVQAQAEGRFELRLGSVNFDAFLAWLARTRSETGLGALSFEAEALEAPGMVRLHCLMAPAGGR